ncbi:hypothetical protein [Alkalibacillus salilacus]|uniref:Chromosome segregation ATPase n=1 Tax=Alkalibacillus salilacus TaxID=284582 RepID=A0ABT9VDE0_9BACI|nr:hypothetical protein [Alkalibacillus salilacus]MDQ0158982.1 chromosome segregation ATPase [Alkalibacillus salilacus]
MTKSSPHSDVKTYQLNEAEHAKIKKQTPDFYVKKREEGYKDKDIAEFMGIPQSKLSTLKNGWGFVGLTFDEIIKQHNKMKRKSSNKKPSPEPASDVEDNESDIEEPIDDQEDVNQESTGTEHSFETLKNDLKQKIEAKDNEIERLQGEVDRLTTDLKQTQKTLNGCNEHVKFMEHQQEEAENEDQSNQENIINDLRVQIDKLKTDIKELEADREWYQHEADNAYERYKTLSKQQRQAESKAYHAIELIKLM